MIDAGEVVAVILAAGFSRRFGEADKLLADYKGSPLVTHSARLTLEFPFRARLAITQPGRGAGAMLSGMGLDVLDNPNAGSGMSSSLAVAARAATALDASACLVLLGDMPNVSSAHVRQLLGHYGPPTFVVASSDGQRRSPPTLFGREHFAALERLTGDAGAAHLVKSAPIVTADTSVLADMDTAEDLARG